MTKTCQSCKIEKELDEFHNRTRAKDGKQTRCKLCNRQQRNDYYKTAHGKERNVLVGKRSYAKNRRKIYEYLLDHPCVDCGEADPIVLEFDHRDRSTKLFAIATVKDMAWSRIEAEIAKCDVRCANCHKRVTAKQFGWSKLEWFLEEFPV